MTGRFFRSSFDTSSFASKSGDVPAEEPDLEPVYSHVDAIANADLPVPEVGQKPYHGAGVQWGGKSVLCHLVDRLQAHNASTTPETRQGTTKAPKKEAEGANNASIDERRSHNSSSAVKWHMESISRQLNADQQFRSRVPSTGGLSLEEEIAQHRTQRWWGHFQP